MGMKKCEECGQEYSDRAEKCPHCGAPNNTGSNKKGKFKIGCLAAVGIFVAIALIGSCSSSSNKNTSSSSSSTSSSSTSSKNSGQKEVIYEDVTVNDMINALNENALSANDTYKGKDLKITGGLIRDIDSDGKYIAIRGTVRYKQLGFPITLYLKSDDVKEQVKSLKMDEHVTVWCHITKVGDTVGYHATLKKIEAAK